MKCNIAVTGVGAVIGHGVVKSIRNSSTLRSSHIIGLDCNPDAVGFFQCDQHYTISRVDAPGYIDSLIDIFKKEAVDVFLPLIEEEFLPVHDNMELFGRIGTRVVIQPRDTIRIFLDKYTTVIALKRLGISTPESVIFTPRNRDKVLQLKEQCGFPLIAKPRRGRGSRGLFLIKNMKQLDAYMELLKCENYLLQQYLDADDEEYTCTIFKTPSMNEPYFIALKRQLLNGTTVSAEVTFDDSLMKTCSDIAKKVPIEGSLNIQIRKKDGTPYVFEINPRYSSTVFIRAMCGFNDVEMGIEYFLNRHVHEMPRVEKCKVVRYWEELCVSHS